jgi:pimeloyl-ACP methyl ester carboxylesterase
MTNAPIILVPGFWLGAWAWDEVAETLRADGHDVTALTLPGLESAEADRSSITFADHVDAICAAVEAAGRPVVLAVHSAAGFSGYAASDRIPQRIAHMVYVDTAPGKGALNPDFDGVELPLNWAEIEEEENLDGLTEHRLHLRAVPGLRQRARLGLPGRHPGTAQCDLGRPSDEPLADVVAPPRARRADRRGCGSAGQR